MIRKIVYFMDNYANLGGAANTLLRQAILMKHAGKTVCVTVSKYGIEMICQDYLDICKREGIMVYEQDYAVANNPEDIDLFSILQNYEGVKNFIEEQRPDIVHSVQLNPIVELACRTLGIPHVMNIYQALPDFFMFQYPDIFSHYHICDSLCYAAFWNRYFETDSYCVRTVAEKDENKRSAIDIKSIKFICVGLLCERKNQLKVIKAFELAIQKGVKGRLQIWGYDTSVYADECRQYIVDQQLQDCIAINGFSDNMKAVYRDSDVLICGSVNESYPNVISEALANGIVVISTPVAGVPEIIKNKQNGYLSRGYKTEEITDSIIDFYKDVKTGKINEILNKADQTYEEVHSQRAVTGELEKTYKKIVHICEKGRPDFYTIEDFYNEFTNIVNRFEKNRRLLISENFVKKNLWKIYLVINKVKKIMLEQDKKCFIWGAGKRGKLYKEILDVFMPDMKITGFVDSYKMGIYVGKKIFPAREIWNREKGMILISVQRSEEIIRNLEAHGYRYGADYFTFEHSAW